MTFNEVGLFRGEDYVVNQYITLHQPTLKEIFDYGEEKYWNLVSTICATPSDLKHQLFDREGLYFNQVDDFDLFLMLCGRFNYENSKIILGNLDFSKLSLGTNTKTNLKVIFDQNSDLIIDKSIYTIIVEYIRKCNGLKRNFENPANDGTRDWLIDESRENYELNKDKEFKSYLMPVISTLVNCADFKYNHTTVWDVPIYSFLDSMKRILHSRNIGYTMMGIYSGTVIAKNLNADSLNIFGEI